MKKLLHKLLNCKGITLVEVIMTLSILGVAICPLTNMFIVSQKIINFSSDEFSSAQLAQFYMEEIKAMEEIDMDIYPYNSENGNYERSVSEVADDYGAEITITPNGMIYYVSINIISKGEIINRLEGSKVFD
ncbi:MAG: prepilin-type N-terminal cleavage/methylation domain-containing protein [Sedimentibacter sp.]